MRVRAIMSKPVVTIEMDDSLAVIKEIFEKAYFHHILVVESNKLYGIISDRDLFKALSPNLGTAAEKPCDVAALNRKAHQIMSRKPICLHEQDEIVKAIEIFQNNKISCIPVVDEDGIPVGVISWRDIFKAIKKTGEPVIG